MTIAATRTGTLPDRAGIATEGGARSVDGSTPWEDLVHSHASHIYGLAYSLTRHRHDAEDLTQDVFIRVFTRIASCRSGNLDAWLRRITVNVFLDQVRRNRHLRLEPLFDETVIERQRAVQHNADPVPCEPVFDDDVREALAALHPDVRTALLLYDVDGLTYAEIAAALGAKRGTIGSRVHRGRAQLRAALAHRRPCRHQLAAKPTGTAVA